MYQTKKRNETLLRMGGRNKKGGKDKNMVATTHGCKNPSNHYNVDGDTEQRFWKFHWELNSKNTKKDNKKKNIITINSHNQVKKSLDMDEKIAYTLL